MFVGKKISSLECSTLLFFEKLRGKAKALFGNPHQVAFVGVSILEKICDFIVHATASCFPSFHFLNASAPSQCIGHSKASETVLGINLAVTIHDYSTRKAVPHAAFYDAN